MVFNYKNNTPWTILKSSVVTEIEIVNGAVQDSRPEVNAASAVLGYYLYAIYLKTNS